MSAVLTSKNLVEVLMKLEPIWESAEEEKEDGQSPKHESCHDRRREPDLASSRGDKVMFWQTGDWHYNQPQVKRLGETEVDLHLPCAAPEINECERSETRRSTGDKCTVGLVTF